MYFEYAFILIILTCFKMSFSSDVIKENIFQNRKDPFDTDADCNGQSFEIEDYKRYPTLDPPFNSLGYFLKVTTTGCTVTGIKRIVPGSQLILVYRLIEPGLSFQIKIGDEVFQPPLNVGPWNTYVNTIRHPPRLTKIRMESLYTSGQPLLVIDRMRIIPPKKVVTEPPTMKTSKVTKFKFRLRIATTATAVKAAGRVSATTTTTSIAYAKKKHDEKAKPKFSEKSYKMDKSEHKQPIVKYRDPGSTTKNFDRPDDKVSKCDYIDRTGDTSMLFWTIIAGISLLIVILLPFLLYLLTKYLIYRNCV